jgi:hypothetical protein
LSETVQHKEIDIHTQARIGEEGQRDGIEEGRKRSAHREIFGTWRDDRRRREEKRREEENRKEKKRKRDETKTKHKKERQTLTKKRQEEAQETKEERKGRNERKKETSRIVGSISSHNEISFKPKGTIREGL